MNSKLIVVKNDNKLIVCKDTPIFKYAWIHNFSFIYIKENNIKGIINDFNLKVTKNEY